MVVIFIFKNIIAYKIDLKSKYCKGKIHKTNSLT